MHNHRDIEGGGGLSPASSLATLHLGQVGQLGHFGQGDQLPGDRAASGDDERSCQQCGWDSLQVEGCLFRVYVSGMSCLSFLWSTNHHGHTWCAEHYRDPSWPGAQWPPWEAGEACCGQPPGDFRCASISWIYETQSLHWFAFLRFCQILGISSGYV